jgi:ferredoxin
MEDNIITVFVQDREGTVTPLDAPTDMSLSLMELLKANEYDVLATCGGMALCATCCVDVLEGEDSLEAMSDDEYAMLDTLPDLLPNSRLACQLKLNPKMHNLKVKLHNME